MALSNLEYRKAIAFGLLPLLEEWAEKGTLGDHDLQDVVEELSGRRHAGVQAIWKTLDVVRNEVHKQGHALQMKRKVSKAEKRKLSQLTTIFAHVTPVLDEFRIKALNERRGAEGSQAM